ncbi:MAG: hypothetical protein HKN29_09985 [Rhodothermales bacterium]|nr:hypothetical protein [Rhodothermales bacterium]
MKQVLLAFLLLSVSPVVTAQISRVSPADDHAGNFFGSAVDIDGDRLLVGSTGYDACGESSGAAFLYEQNSVGDWVLVATLLAGDCEPQEYFGRAVALEGDVAVVTSFVPTPFAARSNAVYVFERGVDGAWRQTSRLTDPVPGDDGPFAASAQVDGGRILVTSAGDTASGRFGGTASLFEKNRLGKWVPTDRLQTPHDARFGVFGTSADLDGDRAVVTSSTYGLNSPGSAHVFERREDDWVQTARIDGVDDYFIPLDLDGNRLILGETREGQDHTGRAVIYELQDAAWKRVADLKPDSPYPGGGFGSAVGLSGDIAAVVGFDEQLKLEFNIDRVVFVFHLQPDGVWKQTQIIDVGEVYFGAALALDDHRAAVGQASEDAAGNVYVVGLR